MKYKYMVVSVIYLVLYFKYIYIVMEKNKFSFFKDSSDNYEIYICLWHYCYDYYYFHDRLVVTNITLVILK